MPIQVIGAQEAPGAINHPAVIGPGTGSAPAGPNTGSCSSATPAAATASLVAPPTVHPPFA